MIIELDIEKSYDRIEWPCILDALQDNKPLQSIISIIMKCIKEGSYNVEWGDYITN